MALGVIAFCGVALVGMLPVGLQVERASSDQMQSTRLLNEIQKDFQSIAKIYSDPNTPTVAPQYFTTTKRFQIPFSLPSTPVTSDTPMHGEFLVDESFLYLGAGGTSAPTARYVAHYDYTHAAANSSSASPIDVPYQIRVLVAWPASAKFVNAGTSLTVTGARGYTETTITINRL